MLETSMAKLFESKKVLASDDDYRQVHAHTHIRQPVAPHKVITSLHQWPVKQALHHTNI